MWVSVWMHRVTVDPWYMVRTYRIYSFPAIPSPLFSQDNINPLSPTGPWEGPTNPGSNTIKKVLKQENYFQLSIYSILVQTCFALCSNSIKFDKYLGNQCNILTWNHCWHGVILMVSKIRGKSGEDRSFTFLLVYSNVLRHSEDLF